MPRLSRSPLLPAIIVTLAGCTTQGSGGLAAVGDVENIDISGCSDVRAVLDAEAEAESIRYPIDAYFATADELGRITQANAA